MLDDIGVFTPDQARKLWQDYLSRQQLQPHVAQNYPQRRPIDEPSPHRVFVKNTSGETCPAYGCMQVTGTEDVGGVTTVTITKPTSTDGEFLFCSQFSISDGACGWAYRFGVVIALGDPPTEAGDLYKPMVDEWTIEDGGSLFAAFGAHNAAANGLIGRIGGNGSGTHEVYFTIDSVECPGDGTKILTVTVVWYTGGCSGTLPGADSYGKLTVVDPCEILKFYTADWLAGTLDGIPKMGRATYMWPFGETGSYCVGSWLVDTICGTPECV